MAFIIAKVSGSTWAPPDASSRSMIGGNHGRAAASATTVAIQVSIFSDAVPGPSAMARRMAR
jgi:hypothetical protein